MTSLGTESPVHLEGGPGHRNCVVYRDGSGEFHLDWPAGRILNLHDLIPGALDTDLSATSNRTNEIMKTLTLVPVMFLPMSFLAGFFGMNVFGTSMEFKS